MLVFTYGTLMRGFSNHRVMQEAKGIFIGEGAIKNKDLYYAFPPPAFPSVVDGDGIVYGEVYLIKDTQKDGVKPLDILDSLEGYDKHNPKFSMYIRKKALCTLKNGTKVWVQYYHWNRKVNKNLKIPDGRFR